METFFQILAVVLAALAGYFLLSGETDRVFLTAVLGAVSYFLSVRFQVKARNKIRETSIEAEMDAAENAEFERENADKT
ncbi:hypothetical protein BH24ACI3_BH24ACI3_12100 [soil metagenome]